MQRVGVARAMNKPTGPSRIVAAEFLRELARNVNVPCGAPEQRAADLRLLADCIEGKVAWRRQNELQHTFAESQRYNLAAYAVEHREPGISLGAALDAQAQRTAAELHIAHVETVRRYIEQARRRERAAGWPTICKTESGVPQDK
jgi:hypothetical protein